MSPPRRIVSGILMKSELAGAMVFQRAVLRGVSVIALSMAMTKPSAADTTAQIALRGVVPPRAAVAFSNVAGSAVIELASAVRNGTAVVDLSAMGNSISRVNMSLVASAATVRNAPALTAADGDVIPYRVRFAGKDLDLSTGQAPLEAGIQGDDGRGGALEIIAQKAAEVTREYTDHLVVVVTAR